MSRTSEIIADIAKSAGDINRNLLLLANHNEARTIAQLEVLQHLIEKMAAWKGQYVHNLRKILGE